jgi:hypothetical protein
MSTLSNPSLAVHHEAAPASVQLRCALTGRPLTPDEAYWAPPLVTARDLIGTTVQTIVRTPGNLGAVLTAEQPNVPYAPEARAELANRRSTEQLKLLALLMLLAAILIVPIVLLVA